jgi:hypothetical protein
MNLRRWVVVTTLAACAGLFAVTGPAASAAPQAVNGFFRVQAATGPDCTSAVGVCLAGEVSGRIKGAFSFAATEIIATTDTPATGVLATIGDAVVETADGDIVCKLTGSLQITGDGPFVSICVVTGGTGKWTGATGYLRTSGSFVFAAGGTGTYDGKVLVP